MKYAFPHIFFPFCGFSFHLVVLYFIIQNNFQYLHIKLPFLSLGTASQLVILPKRVCPCYSSCFVLGGGREI